MKACGRRNSLPTLCTAEHLCAACRLVGCKVVLFFSVLLFVQGEAKVKIHPLICHKKEVEMERNDAYEYTFKTECWDLQLHGSCYIMYMQLNV